MEWEIRDARDSEVEAIVELLRLGLGEGAVPRTEAFWRWKHQANPFGESPVLVAEAGGRLIGVRAFLRWTWHLGGEGDSAAVAAVRAVDTVTHPDWRGRGLFSELTRRLVDHVASEGAAFVFNTPNRKSGPGYLKLGWEEVGGLPVYFRPLRATALPRALLSLLPGQGRGGSEAAAGSDAPPALDPDGGLETVDTLLADPWTATLLDRLGNTRRASGGARDAFGLYRYRTQPTATYLRWRYAAVPGVDYRACRTGDGASAAALVVRGRHRRGLREVSVSEILAVPGEAGVSTAARLLRRLGRSTGADYAVAIASPATPEHAALRRAGFRRLPVSGPRFFIRPLKAALESPSPPPPPLNDPASWRWSTGACELF